MSTRSLFSYKGKRRSRRRRGRGLSSKQKTAVRKIISSVTAKRIHLETIPSTDVGTAGVLTEVNGVSGADPTGDRAHRESFQCISKYFRMILALKPGDAVNTLRVAVVRSQEALGATDCPLLYDFWNATTLKDKGAFVLSDAHIPLQYVAKMGTSSDMSYLPKTLKKAYNLKNMKSIYVGDTAGDLQTGFVYIWMISDSAAGPHPTFEGELQYVFTS